MDPLELEPAEQELCAAIRDGRVARLGKNGKIRAEVLRRIILGLPFSDNAATIVSRVKSGLGLGDEEQNCAKSPIGIAVDNGIVVGRLRLDSAIGEDGGPMCPLAFAGTRFCGGISATHGRFARLSLEHCTFCDEENETPSAPMDAVRAAATQTWGDPTIDLAGSAIDADLDLRSIRPQRNQDRLWIRARGIQVDGEVDLSGSRLRAPAGEDARDPPPSLDLTHAAVNGDLRLLAGFYSRGRIVLRAARVEGDVWMRGATVEGVGDQAALLLQGAVIDGFLMLDGGDIEVELPFDEGMDRERELRFARFRCVGDLNLRAAEVGRELHLNNSVVQGQVIAAGVTVADDLLFNAEVRGRVDLSGCRIGASMEIAGLDLASSVGEFTLKDGSIGRSMILSQAAWRARLIEVRRRRLTSLPAVDFVETLWNLDSQTETGEATVVQAAFLVHGLRSFHLDGHAYPIEAVIDRFGHDVNADTAIEFARLHSAYTIGADGIFRMLTPSDMTSECPWVRDALADVPAQFLEPTTVASGPPEPATGARHELSFVAAGVLDDWLVRCHFVIRVDKRGVCVERRLAERRRELRGVPGFSNGLVWPARDERPGSASAVQAWLVPPAIVPLPRCHFSRGFEERLRPSVQPRPLLQAKFDLEGLTCDRLDDEAARAWGTHFDRIEMNHFVYQRTTWEPDEPRQRRAITARPVAGIGKRSELLRDAIIDSRFGLKFVFPLIPTWYRSAAARLKRLAAERLPVWFVWLFNLGDRLRYGDHWTSAEKKRNWIYRQFDTRGLSSSSKYRVRSHEYRAQPFEQVVRVARAEGREDYASYFEILKERIEWDIFITQHRGWFLAISVVAFLIWLNFADGVRVGAALVVIGALAFLPHIANWVMFRGFGYLRRPIRAICTLIIAFLIGWWGVATANDEGMLIVDVAPVASVVGQDMPPSPEVSDPVIGSPRLARKEAVHNVRCGNRINNALYALDVLIPLIDLREESRCEVGLADDARQQDHVIETFFFENPTTIWAVLKALYAIIGWVIVSLAILTFAHITRPRPEN